MEHEQAIKIISKNGSWFCTSGEEEGDNHNIPQMLRPFNGIEYEWFEQLIEAMITVSESLNSEQIDRNIVSSILDTVNQLRGFTSHDRDTALFGCKEVTKEELDVLNLWADILYDTLCDLLKGLSKQDTFCELAEFTSEKGWFSKIDVLFKIYLNALNDISPFYDIHDEECEDICKALLHYRGEKQVVIKFLSDMKESTKFEAFKTLLEVTIDNLKD